jgi:hypothetical protein
MDNNLELIENQQKETALQIAIGKGKKIFEDENESFEDGDEKLLVAEGAQEPSFPIFMFAAALLKDIFDSIGLTGIGLILTIPFNIIFWIVMIIWSWSKMSGGWWKGRMIKWLWKRFMFAFILDFIPIAPAATILVLMAHNHEKKIVRLFNEFLEELKRAGVIGYIK